VIAASAVYLLSVLVGAVCCFLLARQHRRNPSRLLMAAAVCFAGLALNDIGLIVDVFVLPDVSLVAVRSLPALIGLGLLVHALVKESR
jgi:Family of unknown function (DUF5985)